MAATNPTPRGPAGLSLSGAVGAICGFLPTLTPSLVPRPALFLGLIAGISAAIGYGLLVALAQVAHRSGVPGLPMRRRKPAWVIIGCLAAASVLLGFPLAAAWQNEIRTALGVPPESGGYLVAGAAALAAFVSLLAIGRLVAWLTRAIFRRLNTRLPRMVAIAVSVALVAAAGYLILADLVLPGAARTADRIFASQNEGSAEWVQPTQSTLRSGGPESLVSWESLGREGRGFIASGPDADAISEFTGTPALDPIRIYAGLDSAATAQERADLVLAELERTGAFDREVLVVAGLSGTGWLEPQSIDGLEFLWGGSTAIAAAQYSYLPSWISFLVDQERAEEQGRAIFDTVREAWLALPEPDRPQLIAYGLSLGSFSIQSAFSDADDLAARVDGAILAGTPSFTEPWRSISAARDAGSPQWQPLVQGGQRFRFADDAGDLRALGGWDRPRIAFLQHSNDPVVWWSFDLFAQRPDWLAEPPGPAVSPRMRWLPVITFLQVTVDQFFGVNQPNGQGHNYSLHMAQTWVDVTGSPSGWTQADTDRLQQRLTG